MRRVAAAIALSVGILVPSIASAGRFEGTNLPFAKVLEKAKASKRLVLLDFVRPGCAWCTALERETFSDARVAKALDDFVLARYDAETEGGRGVAQRYRVRGFPTLVVVDAAGRGGRPPRRLLAAREVPGRDRADPRGRGDAPRARGRPREGARRRRGRRRVRAEARARRPRRGDGAARPRRLAGRRLGGRPPRRPRGARRDRARARRHGGRARGVRRRRSRRRPKSPAADDARVARVRLLASEGRLAKALEEAETARGVVRDPAKRAALEETTFHLQRAGLERTLVRWGEGAARGEGRRVAALGRQGRARERRWRSGPRCAGSSARPT